MVKQPSQPDQISILTRTACLESGNTDLETVTKTSAWKTLVLSGRLLARNWFNTQDYATVDQIGELKFSENATQFFPLGSQYTRLVIGSSGTSSCASIATEQTFYYSDGGTGNVLSVNSKTGNLNMVIDAGTQEVVHLLLDQVDKYVVVIGLVGDKENDFLRPVNPSISVIPYGGGQYQVFYPDPATTFFKPWSEPGPFGAFVFLPPGTGAERKNRTLVRVMSAYGPEFKPTVQSMVMAKDNSRFVSVFNSSLDMAACGGDSTSVVSAWLVTTTSETTQLDVLLWNKDHWSAAVIELGSNNHNDRCLKPVKLFPSKAQLSCPAYDQRSRKIVFFVQGYLDAMYYSYTFGDSRPKQAGNAPNSNYMDETFTL